MSSARIDDQLQSIAEDPNFRSESARLVDAWEASNVGVEAVEPILKFMETHPDIDCGAPGPLTHFMEHVDPSGYDAKLLASIGRLPTSHAVGLLNRVINAAQTRATRAWMISIMDRARYNPAVDCDTLDMIDHCIDRYRALGWP